ncbi:MAG: RtcB family protein [Spirochaetota bacterium]
MPININGKYSDAVIFNDNIEKDAMTQVIKTASHPATEGSKIRIMPDVHTGAGICIGFTAKLTDKVVPNWIGVDIGCGVTSYKLGDKDINFDKLDTFIRNAIPSSMNVRKHSYSKTDEVIDKLYQKKLITHNHKSFNKNLKAICSKINEKHNRAENSLGTLGGGNHFIEIDKDNEGMYWLTIHSGSRHFGLSVAQYHQNKAKRFVKEQNYKGISADSAFLTMNSGGDEYLTDMKFAQEYARINRRIMAQAIIEGVFDLNLWNLEEVESVHNYIDFRDNIIRKGAISAYKGEKLIIPLNMRDGIIVGLGKSNDMWNFSAPHGSGRVYSRRQAKKVLSIEEFKKEMKGIWSSSISYHTLDESPMAYKNTKEIIDYIKETVDIKTHMKPVYNFKAE